MVIVLTIITFGIYSIYWIVSTKNEMNRLGTRIPTAWLMIVPIVSIYWMWKYAEGVGQVSKNQLSGPVAFLLMFLLSIIGMAIVQSTFNNVPENASGGLPHARVA